MTIEIEEPGIVVAFCDRCGDRRELGIAPDADKADLDDALEDSGWIRAKPEKHRFSAALSEPAQTVTYEQDFCGDCQAGDAPAAPRFGGTSRPHNAIDAFANDPCDEWPRDLIWANVGLRPECGHPIRPLDPNPNCLLCEAGYPLGEARAAWKR